MNRILAALVLASAFAVSARAQEAKWDARLTSVSGEVSIQPVDGSPEVSGETDMPLEEGDRVVVGEGGSAEISLDGSSLITVRENSDFKLEKTARSESTFFLAVGSILAKIQKLGDERLRVRTPTAVAAVRGTEFGVDSGGEDKDSHVGVFDEGRVEVTGASGGTPELLISNQETSIKKGAAPLHAAQLRRFAAFRAQVRGQRHRLSLIKARWLTLLPEQRRDLRQKAIERMREHRKKLLLKRAALKDKLQEKRKERDERAQQRRQENLRKMEERRKRIHVSKP